MVSLSPSLKKVSLSLSLFKKISIEEFHALKQGNA
jgi:hypothetical protein